LDRVLISQQHDVARSAGLHAPRGARVEAAETIDDQFSVLDAADQPRRWRFSGRMPNWARRRLESGFSAGRAARSLHLHSSRRSSTVPRFRQEMFAFEQMEGKRALLSQEPEAPNGRCDQKCRGDQQEDRRNPVDEGLPFDETWTWTICGGCCWFGV